MKNQIIFIVCLWTVWSCKQQENIADKVAEVKVEFKVNRFEKDFFGDKPMQTLRENYPDLLDTAVTDEAYIALRQDSLMRPIYEKVEAHFGDFTSHNEQIEQLFKYIKYYYPQIDLKSVVTVVNAPFQNQRAYYIADEQMLYIPLESYLGENDTIYAGLYNYQRRVKNTDRLLVDVAMSVADYIVTYDGNEAKLIQQFVYYGKKKLLLQAWLPSYTEAQLMNYTEDQWNWVKHNEYDLWNYYIEEEMLFKNDPDYRSRFFDLAPYSKFYTDHDNQIPPSIGVWQGWQLMQQYQKNHPTLKLPEIIAQPDALKIYQASQYKPKRQN